MVFLRMPINKSGLKLKFITQFPNPKIFFLIFRRRGMTTKFTLGDQNHHKFHDSFSSNLLLNFPK